MIVEVGRSALNEFISIGPNVIKPHSKCVPWLCRLYIEWSGLRVARRSHLLTMGVHASGIDGGRDDGVTASDLIYRDVRSQRVVVDRRRERVLHTYRPTT